LGDCKDIQFSNNAKLTSCLTKHKPATLFTFTHHYNGHFPRKPALASCPVDLHSSLSRVYSQDRPKT